ncbi:MAG: sigma-70 family RNA polymerase sigma factor [Solirubrobacteraceae bacterium]
MRREWRPPATDDELVAATRANDDRAFEVLYARYQRRIAAYVLGMVKDHGRAEDVTQEVFVSALRRLRQTGGPIAFKPWIYEIAKNACIDQFRRSRRAEEVSFDAEEGVGPTLVSSRPGPEAELSSRMELDSLRSAFVGLTDTHHRILVMRELEGRSYAEIGQRMGLSRPAVESTLFRARKRLAEEYDELVSGERCRRVQAIIAGAGAERLGARDQRRMARHVSCCAPCRRALVAAGLGDRVPAGVGAKIAALLPLPAFLRERWLGLGGHHAAAGSDAAAGGGAGALASWAHAAGPVLDAGGGGWLKAVATAATVAVAGVGANVVTSSHQAGVERAGDPGALVAAVSGRAASVAAPVPAAVSASVAARRVQSAATSAPTAIRPAHSRRATRPRRDRGGAGATAGRPASATTAPAAGGTKTVSAPSASGSGGSVGTTVHGTGSTGAGSGAGSGSGSGTRSGSGSGSGSGRTTTPLERAAGDVTHAVSGAVGGATGATTTSTANAGSLAGQLPSTPVASLGDTPIQVPTTTDVIDTVHETVAQADQTVTGVTGVVGDTTQDVGDTATGLTGGLLGG